MLHREKQEIVFAEYFSRLLSNIQSEQSYDHSSHVRGPAALKRVYPKLFLEVVHSDIKYRGAPWNSPWRI